MDRESKYIILIGIIASAILFTFFILSTPSYANISAKNTELEIHNPYSSVSIRLLVKCDYNNKTGGYKFFKNIVVNRNSNTSIRAPAGLKKCEIWPIGIKLFGDL